MAMNKLKKVLTNLPGIFEGIKNKLFPTKSTEEVKQERLKICRSNRCGYYDEHGKSPAAVVPGVESCGACGCSLEIKTGCMSCKCGLEDLNLPLMWDEA